MNRNKDGKITLPVDFNNKNRLVSLSFFVMYGGGYFLKVGGKSYPIADSGQVSEIVLGVGEEAMEALNTLMKDAKVGTAFTLMCQIREQPNAVVPGIGFVDEQLLLEFHYL